MPLVLVAGFGAGLGVMAFAGLDSIRVAHDLEVRSVELNQTYLVKRRSLERIRSGIYLSATFVRDYLLEADPQKAVKSLATLQEMREEMIASLQLRMVSAPVEEVRLIDLLRAQLLDYWASIQPLFLWGPRQRTANGFAFLQSEVLPRRAAILSIAGEIDGIIDLAVHEGNRQSERLYEEFLRRLSVTLALTLTLGVAVAGGSILYFLRLENEARQRYREIHELSARLVDAHEEERRSISRDLHDQIGQALTALLIDVGNLSASIPVDQKDQHTLLGSIKKLAEQSVSEVRNMALLLRPSMLDDLGLEAALKWHAREVSRRTGLAVEVDALDDAAGPLTDQQKTCVYRVVQEALHNCVRHAEARHAKVSVKQERERLLVSVQDDGRGFDSRKQRGLGLTGMEERIHRLGGTFQVHSQPGKGTLIEVQLPLS